MSKPWFVFYLHDKELAAYTLHGTFAGEAMETKKLLAYEHGVSEDEIAVVLENR